MEDQKVERRRTSSGESGPTADTFEAPRITWSLRARVIRVAPFVGAALLAEASGLWPPGPRSLPYYFASLGLLSVSALLLGLGMRRSRLANPVGVILLYLASWALLSLAEGGPGDGVLIVAMLPVLWAASFESKRVSTVTVLAMSSALAAEVLLDTSAASLDLRRWLFLMALAILVTVTIRNLRRVMTSAISERDEILREDAVLAGAERELFEIRHPDEVVRAACRAASNIASSPQGLARRSTYLRVGRGVVSIVAGFDPAADIGRTDWLLSDHPYLATVIHRREPFAGPLHSELLGETLRGYAEDTGVTHGAWVPITLDGKVDGVLSVMGQGEPISEHLLGQLEKLGRIVEPALANARTNELVEEESLTDPLTGLLNRRGLMRAVPEATRGRNFAVLSVDLDGLKQMNDTHGHAAGDVLIGTVASALTAAVRRQDSCARVGGDEFVALIVDGDASLARTVANRMLAHLSTAGGAASGPRVSVGIADGGAGDRYATIAQLADVAMYVAKRKGGDRVEIQPRSDVAAA